MKKIYFLIILFLILSCSNKVENNSSCNFSSNTSEPERCFGGVGDRCKGIFLLAPMSLNYETCTVDGYMSIGSIEHDKCCIKTLNKGKHCAFPEKNTKLCSKEWDKAVADTLCSSIGIQRQWKVVFGKYPIKNHGDSTDKLFYAPKNFRVHPDYQKYCKNGCKKNSLGEILLYEDFCGTYCICN